MISLNQKQLAEWVEDYSDFIQVFSTTGELIKNSVASAAVRNMKFEAKAGRESNVDDFSHHQSEYEIRCGSYQRRIPNASGIQVHL